jgi:hypothetical protein
VVPLLRRAVDSCLPEGSRLTTRSHFRSEAATFRTRSALAVPPGCDGLLHLALCRFVAPCCRSWGSPCFRSHEAWCGPDRSVRRSGRKWSRLETAFWSHPEGAPIWLSVADLAMRLWFAQPRGVVLTCVSPRGSHSFPLNLPQWRYTLRSFPLVSSCSASTVLFSRTPYLLPSPSEPGSGVVSEALFDLMARITAVVAFSSLFEASSWRASTPRKRWVSAG